MYELVILGAGPIGLYAAFYAGMRNLKTIVYETKQTHGGQPYFLYPQKPIYDVPGHKEITAQELVNSLYNQYLPFSDKAPIQYNSQIEAITKIEEGFELVVNGQKVLTKCILSCSGNGNFKPIKLELPDADLCNNIIYKLDDLNLYKNKKIVILGGGDTALDLANMAVSTSMNTTIVHRRNEFRAHEESINNFRAHQNAILATNKTIIKINRVDNLCKSLTLLDNETGQSEELPVDFCVVSYGMKNSPHPLSKLVVLEEMGIRVQSNMETSMPGIYAAGNSASYFGKTKTLASGFGEVLTAITAIHQYLYPNKNPQYYSSVSYKNN